MPAINQAQASEASFSQALQGPNSSLNYLGKHVKLWILLVANPQRKVRLLNGKNQSWAYFVLNLKVNNTFLKNNIGVLNQSFEKLKNGIEKCQ